MCDSNVLSIKLYRVMLYKIYYIKLKVSSTWADVECVSANLFVRLSLAHVHNLLTYETCRSLAIIQLNAALQ